MELLLGTHRCHANPQVGLQQTHRRVLKAPGRRVIPFTFLLLSDKKEAQIHGQSLQVFLLQKPFLHLRFRSQQCGPGPRPPIAPPPGPPAFGPCSRPRLTSSRSLVSAVALSRDCIDFLFANLHLSPQRLSHQKPHRGPEGADVGLFLLSGFSLRVSASGNPQRGTDRTPTPPRCLLPQVDLDTDTRKCGEHFRHRFLCRTERSGKAMALPIPFRIPGPPSRAQAHQCCFL